MHPIFIKALIFFTKRVIISLMKITKDTTVSLEYTLKDDSGEIIDSSAVVGAMEYIHGYNMIIPGLEKALEGKDVDEELDVTIPPESAYGEVHDDLIVETSKEQFPDNIELEVGMEFESGQHTVRIVKIEGDSVTIDANHPLAGETLHCQAKILAVRATSEAELADLFQSAGGCGCAGGCGVDMDGAACGGCSGCF